MSALIDELLAPIRQRVRALEDDAGIVARQYTGWTGWVTSTPVTPAAFAGATSFEDGLITVPAGGPGRHWFAVPLAEGYPDYVFLEEAAMSGAWARQAVNVVYDGATWIIGVSTAVLATRFAGLRVRLEYT